MSIRFEVSEIIRASPERILDAMLDLERAHLWMPGLVRMESLSPEPLAAGSEWRETRKFMGKEATEQFRVTDLERPRRLELMVDGSKGSTGKGEYHFSYRLEPTGAAMPTPPEGTPTPPRATPAPPEGTPTPAGATPTPAGATPAPPEGTTVHLSGEIRGMTGIMGWIGKLLVGPYKKACSKDLAALKAYLEKESPAEREVEPR